MTTAFAALTAGPEVLRLPGAPDRLSAAVEHLQQMATALEQVGTDLRHADPDGPRHGRTVGAVSRVGQRIGAGLDDDAERLRRLSDAVSREAELLAEAKADVLPALRQRWRAAEDALLDAVQAHNVRLSAGDDEVGGGRGRRVAAVSLGSRIPGQQLVAHLNGNLLEPHEALLRRLTNQSFADGGGFALMSEIDGELQAAVHSYRQTVRQLLEDYADLADRIERADADLAENLPRTDRAVLSTAPVAQQAPAEPAVSGVGAIRRLAAQLREGAQALNQADEHLDPIGEALKEGRMLPHGERQGSNDGFRRDWNAHLDDLRQRLNGAHEKAGAVAERMEQLDEEGAADVRQAARADD